MSKPQIRANGGSPGVKASVAASSTVNLTLDSTVGVRSVQWSIETTDETSETTDYTIAQTGSLGQNASLTALGEGTAVIVKVRTNNGLVRELPDPVASENTIKIFVPTSDGLEVGTAGERYESDSTHGTTGILNQPIRVLNTFTTSQYESDVKRAKASSVINTAITGNPSPLDGVTIVTSDIVLLTANSTGHQNGLWVVNTTGAWTRPANFNSTAAAQGAIVAVVKGTVRAGYLYQCTNTNDPVIGTTSLTFLRLPDKYDRADLQAASATPASTVLTRYGSANELNASYLTSSSTNPAGVGFIRSIANQVAVAFRNAANSSDLQALSMDATNVIRVGSAQVAHVVANVISGGEVKFVNDAVTFLRHALTGTIFGSSTTMSITHTAGSGAGSNAEFVAQGGAVSFAGGNMRIASGTAGTGSTPGNVIIDAQASTTSSGRISFYGGVGKFDEFIGFSYTNTPSTITTIEIVGARAKVIADDLEFDVDNVSFFSSPGSFGGGKEMLFITNTTNTPGSNPTGGGLLYVEAGALWFKGSAGTLSMICPA